MPHVLSASPHRRFILVLMVFMVAKGLLWAVVVPAWQTPDEGSHFAYIESIASGHGVLPQNRYPSERQGASYEAFRVESMIFHPEIKGPFTHRALARQRSMLAAANRMGHRDFRSITTPASGYPPLYYSLAAGWYRLATLLGASYVSLVFWVRLLSVLISAAVVGYQFDILRRVLDSDVLARLSVTMIALMPMVTFAQMSVNTAVLDMALASIVMWGLIVAVQDGITVRRSLLVGVVMGLGFLTKQGFAILLVPCLIALAACIVRARGSRLRTAAIGVVAPVSMAALSAWYYLAGSPGGAAAESWAKPLTFTTSTIKSYMGILKANGYSRDFSSFWGSFGWMDTWLSPWTLNIIAAVCGLALAGCVFSVMNSRKVDWSWLVITVSVLSYIAMIIVVEYGLVVTQRAPIFIQGRYLFPVITPIVALMVYGLTRPLTGVNRRVTVVGVCVAGLAVLHVVSLTGYVIPRYWQ